MVNIDINKVYTFTFVRNPFDKLLSSYLNYTINNTPNFDDYIDMVEEVVENKLYLTKSAINSNDLSHYIPMSEMIGDNKLDFIGRFENFDEDIIKLSKKTPYLQCLNDVKIRKRTVNYRNYYSQRNKKIIEKLYEKDLKNFNYKF